jgi:hypothetical protein
MAKKSKNRSSAVARHADYTEMQNYIDAPFGKAFKTGGHKTGAKDVSRKRAKQDWKRQELA